MMVGELLADGNHCDCLKPQLATAVEGSTMLFVSCTIDYKISLLWPTFLKVALTSEMSNG